jgi:parallel beta-helix repeat protein
MLTLNQIEPRTPITNLPYNINASGSYYVTTNLTCTACSNGVNGITVSTFGAMGLTPVDNVTIDLSGFTLFGANGSASGIYALGGHNYVVRNGTLRNWGADGVNALSSVNNRIENLQLYANANLGLAAGVGSVVVNCEAYSNTVAGFQLAGGEISHCVAFYNTGIGILASNGCVVGDCTAQGNGSDGIDCAVGTTVRNCSSYQNRGNGVTTVSGCTIIGCTASGNSSFGIVGNNCTIKDCTVSGNLYGIFVGAYSTVKDCTATTNVDAGILISVNGCLIAGNTCGGNDLGIWIDGVQIALMATQSTTTLMASLQAL